MDIIDCLKEKIAAAEKAGAFALEKLSNAPEGILLVRTERGVARYYQRQSVFDKNGIYLGNKYNAKIKALQEKAFYSKLLKVAEGEKKSLEKALSILQGAPDHEKVYIQIPESKRNMIKPYLSDAEEKIRKQLEREYRQLQKENSNKKGVGRELKLLTQNGERVRSKSELIIADRLKAAGIPYFYEGQFTFIDDEIGDFVTWFPDFQVFNIKTGQKYFWEHFGLLDNADYCLSFQYKLETYAKQGIFPGKNLIISTETSAGSLNTDYIDSLINEYLR